VIDHCTVLVSFIICLTSGGCVSVNTPCLTKTCHFYFLNNLVKHWLILIIFGSSMEKPDINDYSFGRVTLTLLLLCEMQKL